MWNHKCGQWHLSVNARVQIQELWEAVITEAQTEEWNKLHAAKHKLSLPRPGVERSRSSALVYLLGTTAALLNMPLLEMSHRVLVFRPFLLQINFNFSSISQPLKASSVSLIRLQLHLHLHTISSLFPVSKLGSLCFRCPLQIQAGSETMEMKILKWYKKGKPDKAESNKAGGYGGTHACEDNDSVNRLQVETTYPNNLGWILIRKSKMLTSTSV